MRIRRPLLSGTGLVLFLALLLAPVTTVAQPGDNPDEPPVASTPAPDRVLFLRADKGVSLSGSEVTTWADQTSNNNDATNTLTGPELAPSPSGLNGKPALRFDRSSEKGLGVANTDDINTGGPYPERTISLTFRTGSDVSSRQIVYEEGGGVNGFNVYVNNGSVHASAWDDAWTGAPEGQFSVSKSVSANTTYVLTFVFDEDATAPLQLFLDGTQVATNSDSSIDGVDTHGGDITIGNTNDGTQVAQTDVSNGGEGFAGDIAEVILSNTAVNTAQRQILESALSEKYGVSVANDRYAQSGYENDVIGVGQANDGSKQTSDSLGVLFFETSSLSNGSFGLLGHEGSGATFEGETDPTNIGERLSRVWRVGGTGTLPSLTVKFDVSNYSLGSNQDYKLLLESSGGTFGSGATVVDGTLNGDTFTVSSSALSSAGLAQGDYLTLAKTSGDVTGPAGLSYSPNPLTVANEDVNSVTATADLVTEGQPAPTFNVVDVRRGLAGSATSIGASLPDGITLEGDGDVVVDPTASSQGRFEIDIEASNSGGTTAPATLVVEITKAVSVAYTSQTDAVNANGTRPSFSISPPSLTVNEGSFSYSVIDGSLEGLAPLNSSDGSFSGTPSETGLIRAKIEVTADGGMATGADTAEVNIAVVGGDGPSGVGDDSTTIGRFDASLLSAADGDEVTTWTDTSAYGNDADLEPETGTGPTYRSAASGFNNRPAVDFSGTSDVLAIPNNTGFNTGGGEPYVQRTLTLVARTGSDVSGSTPEVIYGEGGGSRGLSVYLRNGDLYTGIWNENDDDETSPWGEHFFQAEDDEGASGEGTVAIDANTTYLVTFRYSYVASEIEAYVNGTLIGRQTTDVGRLFGHANGTIGGKEQGLVFDGGSTQDPNPFTGQIGTVVAYEVALTDAQRQVLESGLGAKYGIGVANNRFDFAGTEEFTFANDVVGFGQTTDSPNPHTPQAVSDLLTVSPSAMLADGDFTVIGHDASNKVFSSEPDVTDFDGSGTNVDTRLARTWRVDVANTAAFSYSDLSIDVSNLNLLSGQSYVLLVDSDPSFTASSTVVEGTVSGGTFTPDGTVHGSALADADYLTLARTEGDAAAPTNLTYDPGTVVIENGIGPDSTASPSFDGGTPAPDFSITANKDNPSAVSIDSQTGVITVDAETGEQGVFDVEVKADNTKGSTTTTVTVRIVEPVTVNYDIPSQTVVVDDGTFNTIQTTTPNDLSGINDATGISYSVVDGNLDNLSLNSSTGSISGTPDSTGVIRAEIKVTGSGGASGADSSEVNVAVVGADGPGAVGDAFGDDGTAPEQGAIIADFDAGVLDADNGDELSAWTDTSNYDNTVNLSAGTGPLYRTGENTTGFNGRPAVDFSNASGPSDLLVMQDNAEFNTGGAPYVQRTVATVFRTSDDISNNQPEGIFGEGGGSRGLSIYTRDGDLYAGMWNQEPTDDETTPWGPYFFSAETDEGASGEGTVTINGDETYLVTLRYHYVESEIAMYVNGTLVGKQTTNVGRLFGHANAVLGGGESFDYDAAPGNDRETNYNEFEGQIGELLVYNVALPDAQRQILESALAVKYGISPIANARFTDAEFGRNVVGFGQLSDNPAPHDPKATTDIITINPSVASDGDFSVIGHDDSTNAFGPEGDLNDYRDDGTTTTDDQIDSRLKRTWRAKVSGSGAFDAGNLTFDVSAPAFDLASGQEYAILIGRGKEFPGNDDTKVVTGSVSNDTFTPGTGTAIEDGQYVTLAKKLGDPAEPKNLSYPTLAVEAGTGNTDSGAPSYDGGQPLPSFSFVTPGNVPNGITIDNGSGAITVDASTAPQGLHTFDVKAENNVTSGSQDGQDQTTVTVRVFERLEDAELALTLPDGESLSGTTLNFTPSLSALSDANVSYTVKRVNRFGTIESDLSNSNLSFDTNAGTFSGAPSSLGTVAVTIEAVGSGGVEGTVRAQAKITKIGSSGLAGIGDATTTLLDLSANDLSLADGDAVSTWPDTSAYENDATAGTAPTFKTGTLNGQPTVRFDGNDDELSIASSASLNEPNPILHRAYTIVFNTGSSVSSGTQNIYNEQGGTRGYRLYIESGELRVEGRNNSESDDLIDPANDNLSSSADPTTPWENETGGDGDVLVTTSVSANQTYVATLFHDYAKGTIELWVNGESKGSADGAGRQYGHTNGVLGAGSFEGDLGALYATDASLNMTQRTLLHNALAAEYGVGLAGSATDVYAGHTGGNGDYDFGVFGVGREAAADLHTAAGADGLRFDGTSGLDSNDDYLVVGHGVSNNSVTTSDVTAGNVSLKARSQRTWYVDETDSGSGLTVNVTFDLNEMGLKGPAGDKGNYTLLARSAGTSNDWTDLKTANGLTVTKSGSEITFQGVDLASGDEITLGTTDRENSPLDTGEQALIVEGTAGADGVDQGWRYLGFPGRAGASTPPQAKDLRRADGSQFIDFTINMAYRNDGEPADCTSNCDTFNGLDFDGSGFTTLSESEDVALGRGFIVWLFDNNRYPLDPSITLQTADGFNKVGATDITVGDETPNAAADPSLSTGDDLFLLANPYAEPFDLGSLGSPGSDDFDTVVQIWEPDADDSGNDPSGRDDANVGSFVTKDRNTGDDIAPWQGFLLTRNSSTQTQITFKKEGRLTGSSGVPFVGSKSKAGQSVTERRIALEVVGRSDDSTIVEIDKAASVLFRAGAGAGRDQYDAPKIASMGGGAALSPVATGPDTSLRAQESRPLPEQEATVPLFFQSGEAASTYTLQTPEWTGVPEEWTVELVDTKRTADPGDDQTYQLSPGGKGYSFTPDGDTKTRATTAASSKSASAGSSPPRPRFGRLHWDPRGGISSGTESPSGSQSGSESKTGTAGSQSTESGPLTRFRLRVETGQEALPVELAGFEVRTGRREATLKWHTASETGNAGFVIQHQRLGKANGDTTVSAAAWQKLGFVEGAGTTSEPQSYRFETDKLKVGRHAFRLRQVDTDGSAHPTKARQVALRLEEAYAVTPPHPNPAVRRASLDLTVREKQRVTVRVYDVLGREVVTPHRGPVEAQDPTVVTLPADRLASGQYFVRVDGEHFQVTRRMTVVR
jgi:hypothetical protein